MRRLSLAVTLLGCGPVLAAPPPAFSVCTDYHCDVTATVTLSEAQWRQIRAALPPASTAEVERDNLRQAIGWLETLVGPLAGTAGDLPRNAGEDEIGQLDCIAESRNTTTYLQLLADAGLLRWHTVEERKRRNPRILDYHWTAVIRDRETAQGYAVDSWFLANGDPPYVQALERWLTGKSFDK